MEISGEMLKFNIGKDILAFITTQLNTYFLEM